MNDSPFSVPPKGEHKKHKLLLLGWAGTGKSTTAAQFDNAAVLDLDGGCDRYGDKYKFHVIRTSNLIEIKQAIYWLITEKHEFETIVIDPITIYWELLQKYWSDIFIQRNTGHRANKYEFYDFGPKEWSTCKMDFRTLFNKLNEADINIVCTCREKDNLVAKGGTFVNQGLKPDCEKGVEFLFDTVIRLYREGGKYMAECKKDRDEALPADPFEFSYDILMTYLNKKDT